MFHDIRNINKTSSANLKKYIYELLVNMHGVLLVTLALRIIASYAVAEYF